MAEPDDDAAEPLHSRHLRRVRQDEADRQSLRLGATVLGGLAGLAAGLVLAALRVRMRWADGVSAPLVLGLAVMGAVLGWWRTAAGWGVFEAVLHYLIGFWAGSSWPTWIRPSPEAPRWLRAVLYVGVVCGLLAWLAWGVAHRFRRW
ncbi:MAG: hypothetical protein CFE45_13195 [Burkholderiales bacterium PBB5]|nr:MAG: hypothetical protein CFE45_13195 [Burkholderiales bacterium PBB5]